MITFATDWSQLLKGEPETLQDRAGELQRQAAAIQEAAAALHEIASGQLSEATTALKVTASELQTSMSQAHLRYDETAVALRTYAVALAPIKQQASRDIPALDEAQARLGSAQSAESSAHWQELRDVVTGADASARADTTEDLLRAQKRAAAAQGEIEAILARLRAGAENKENAAQAAIRAIEMVISQGADTVLDNIAQFFEGVGDFLAMITRWATEFLKDLVRTLIEVISTVVAALLIVGLLLLSLGTILALLGLAIINPALAAALLPAVLLTLGAAIVGVGASVLMLRVLSDALKPTPTVTKLPADQIPSGAQDPSWETVLGEAGQVDSLGGADQTVVQITEVPQADGTSAWRIVLPSTQDWQAMSSFMSKEDFDLFKAMQDSGAMNDVDSNLALVLFPSLQTQYERMVLEAMAQANIPPTEPVMLVGFSQGGIMAGHLAANRSDLYNFQAVVVCGSPIDNMAIPPKTDVISVQHTGDPVHTLDFFTPPPSRPGWTTFAEDPPPGATEVDQIHNADNYNTTLSNHAAELEEMYPDLDDVFFTGSGASQTEYYVAHE